MILLSGILPPAKATHCRLRPLRRFDTSRTFARGQSELPPRRVGTSSCSTSRRRGLSPAERLELIEVLTSLLSQIGDIIIEHDMDVALRVVESVTMMHNGRFFKEGGPRDIETDPEVRREGVAVPMRPTRRTRRTPAASPTSASSSSARPPARPSRSAPPATPLIAASPESPAASERQQRGKPLPGGPPLLRPVHGGQLPRLIAGSGSVVLVLGEAGHVPA
jgi:hypothetical protein